jgi:adenylate kinase
MKYSTILLFGAPGAGKGTQGKILGTIPGLFHFACGDAFRKLSINDPLAKVFIEHSSKGRLVPDEATIDLWRKNIGSCTHDGSFDPANDTLVLDGIPRNPRQAEILRDTLDVKALLHLTCEDMGKMVQRLQRRAFHDNRLDDANLEVIKHRLKLYEQETRPVLDYYGLDLVHTIDSTKTPVNVLLDILRVVCKLIP